MTCFTDENFVGLRLQTLVEKSLSDIEGKIKLQDAICNECFEKIFRCIESKLKNQHEDKKKYAEQLQILEGELQLRNKIQSQTELQDLEEEERRLDQELAALELEEQA